MLIQQDPAPAGREHLQVTPGLSIQDKSQIIVHILLIITSVLLFRIGIL